MSNKSISVSLRLSEAEYSKLTSESKSHGMTNSNYIRHLISNDLPTGNCPRKEIAALLCDLYIKLTEQGLDSKTIEKEVHRLCQILS